MPCPVELSAVCLLDAPETGADADGGVELPDYAGEIMRELRYLFRELSDESRVRGLALDAPEYLPVAMLVGYDLSRLRCGDTEPIDKPGCLQTLLGLGDVTVFNLQDERRVYLVKI